MRPTAAEIKHIESFFETVQIPRVLQLNKSTRQTDVLAFLKHSIQLAKDPDVADIVVTTRWYWVEVIKGLLMQEKSPA